MDTKRQGPSEGRRFALVFLLGVVLISTPFWLFPDRETSMQVAASGGIVAFLGVVLIARPVWRVGPLEYVSLAIFRSVVDARDNPRYARLDDPHEKASDDAFQQVIGPMLVGIGTLLNGFSGYIG